MDRRWTGAAAVAAVLGLLAAGCGDDDDAAGSGDEAAEAAPATTAATTTGGPPGSAAPAVDLAGVCPDPLVVQKDWLAEVEHGGLHQLIGGDARMERGLMRGPLGSTGIELVILEGGPHLPDIGTAASLHAGNPVAGLTPHLAYVTTDDQVIASERFPTTAVVAPLERNPQMLMFDPEAQRIETLDDLRAAVAAGAELYVGSRQFSYVKWLIGQGIPEDAVIEGYAGDKERFITGGGRIIQQGFASNEPWSYEHETPEWGRPVDYVLIDDLGFRVYAQTLAVATGRLEELSPCLELLVPLIQQAQIDFVRDPAEVSRLIVEFNERDLGAAFWKTSPELNEAGVRVMLEEGIVGDGGDGTLGDLDEARVQAVIDALLPILAEEGSDSHDPEVTAADLVTNEFVDPTISLDG